MNGETLIIFVILLIVFIILIVCCFLGVKEGFESNTYNGQNGGQLTSITTNNGNTYTLAQTQKSNDPSSTNMNYDNYNHYTGASHPVMFYGPDGGTARVIQIGNSDTLVITYKNGTTDIYYIDHNNSDNTNSSNTNTSSAEIKKYYGPNGASAKIVTTSNGKKAVEITTMSGTKIVYTEDNPYAYGSSSQDSDMNENENEDDTSNVNQAYSNTTDPYVSSNSYKNQYYNNSVPSNSGSNSGSSSGSSSSSTNYSNSLPPGIPRSMIPRGQEDLYILKSEVVPPVCPACPPPIVQCPDKFDASKCPACPPCARCPESPFECKKVPNYNASNPDYVPVPVLSDFSTFGM